MILWDQGPGGSFVAVAGNDTANLATSITVTTGISSGDEYQFKYFGRNAHGDGLNSSTVTILAATVPSQMNPPTVSAVSAHSSLQYRVSVVAPYSGGDGVLISEY